MKKYIKASVGKYGGEAYETYKKLTNDKRSYKPNQFYVNEKFGKIFYINNQGYLHVLLREGGCIEDYMLTKDNQLKWTSTYCRPKYDKEEWAQFKRMLDEAERV